MKVLGLGLDVVDLQRIETALQRHGERFYRRILTEAEQSYCLAFRDPLPPLAARFAAKEAVAKALGTGISGGINWTDIEVERLESGCPVVKLHGEAREQAAKLGVQQWNLTMSHTRTTAAAVALATG